jgi:hypothetical protein
MRHIIKQLDVEIMDTKRRLAFWQEQFRLQAGTELAEYVRRIEQNYSKQLDDLEIARKQFDA